MVVASLFAELPVKGSLCQIAARWPHEYDGVEYIKLTLSQVGYPARDESDSNSFPRAVGIASFCKAFKHDI